MKGLFSDALLRAAETEAFRYWFNRLESEVNYAIRTYTSWAELDVFDEELTQDERTLFLLFVAEAFKEHGL